MALRIALSSHAAAGAERKSRMKKFVWDTSALVNIKEPNEQGYSPAYSFMTDFFDGWIDEPYQNIFPANAVFEVAATISRKHREGIKILRELYIVNEHSRIYDIDTDFIRKTNTLVASDGFSKLRGGDLIFACIAYVEDAYLVTLDGDYDVVSDKIKVINLRDSLSSPRYRRLFEACSREIGCGGYGSGDRGQGEQP